MLRTITIGSCVTVRGFLVRYLEDGRALVRVGNRTYQGHPVELTLKAA